MLSSILPISGSQIADSLQPAGARPSISFQDVLTRAVAGVEDSSNSASASIEQLLGGEGGEVHNAVLATQKAELEFELFLQVRNKVVSAYQEIMRMQM